MVFLNNGGVNKNESNGKQSKSQFNHRPDEDESGNESSGGSGVEDGSEREGRIRVGKDYQATPPPFIAVEERKLDECPERALLVWSPSLTITTSKLDEYISVSKEKYGYNAEQALGMLFWHKHDLERAIQDLANFTPFPDEWTVEDKVLFEQAFQFHGKSFHRIRQMLPDKSIAQLVKYYYSWKKTRTRTSLMDRQAKKLQFQREDPAEDNETQTNSEDEEKGSEPESFKPKCFNCGILCHVTHSTAKGQMCGTCHQYYTRTGQVRPTTGPIRKDGTKGSCRHSIFKNNNKPPKGMYVNHDDLVALATGHQSQGDSLLKSMDADIVSNKRTVQNYKQLISSLQRRTREIDVEPYRTIDFENKINSRWTNDELLLGVQGVRQFGKNFKVIAEILGSKTESHVRSFFTNYERRYNLDVALKEYEDEHGPWVDDDETTDMESEETITPIENTSESSSPNSNSPIVVNNLIGKNGVNPISAK